MRWQRIDDNEQAWELLQAGLLWFGEPDGRYMCHYNAQEWRHIEKEHWMEVRFTGGDKALPNHIRVED